MLIQISYVPAFVLKKIIINQFFKNIISSIVFFKDIVKKS